MANTKYKTYKRGDYVLSPCKNAFNDQTSYWLSRKDYTFAVYAFTPISKDDLSKEGINEQFDVMIPYFEKMLARIVKSA